jgi:hypothetical protein
VADLRGDVLGERRRAVGAAVVDHEDVAVGQGLHGPPQHELDVGRLLVGGDHHEGRGHQ